MKAIGLMSGTSLDGIDVALIETDGAEYVRRGPSETFPYDAEMRGLLSIAISDARELVARDDRPASLANAEIELTRRHAAAVERFLSTHAITRSGVDIIGFHGQTVLHRTQDYGQSKRPAALLDAPRAAPAAGTRVVTVQLGLGQMLADLTGVPVVYDLRAADADNGGQGAPLVPVYHRALTAKLPQRPLAIVNVGGVSNVTFIGEDGALTAFDTGPGNALVDDWMQRHAGRAYDDNGDFAALGHVDPDILLAYLNDAFFAELPPKSLDRNAFTLTFAETLSASDGAATLSALTAHAIAKSREHLPQEPQLWIVGGGGRKNKTIMKALAGLVEHAVVPAEAVGLNGDSIEAEAWAYLAVRSLKELPITFPGTTGVAQPMTGGRFARPHRSFVH